ncbi:hypothetical protein F4813DRAFT_48813 [Daldinia decipiens]|uniref:uncharacterized protein n=1 Tax=Daldinia decipiens TaxID=326647 RepID=UPI0020C23E11|nr:uncharacterized protein F4813DRAFT_48813 [Daldinia decipiens]KAI1658428.1 hypothetical protein F4813DRAFT_48813 [Daldinia decipiens]
MEKKDNSAIRRRAQHRPQYTLNSFLMAMGFINPLRAPPPSRHPTTLWAEPMRLPRTTSRQVKEGLDTINVKDDKPNSAKTETTIDSNNSPSGGSPTCHNAPPLLHHPNYFGLRAAEWRSFPPEVVPRFDLTNSTTLSEEKSPDVERLTNKYLTQSITFRRWVKQKNKELDSLSSMEQHDENIEDEILADRTLTNAEKRQAVVHEIQETYAALVDTETIEAQVSARRQAAETLQRQRRLPLTAAKRLLGSDGSSFNNYGVPKEKHLYIVGPPQNLVRLPFDQAVDAGLEVIHPPRQYASPDLPGTLQTLSPPPQESTPGAPFSFGPSTSPRRNLHIPEWFEHFKMPLKGRNREARWNDLMNRISTLETKIRHNGDDEASGKSRWDKKWHEPNKKWPFAHRREHGGWWKCRSGRDAPEAERKCWLCHGQTETPEQATEKRSAKEKLDELQSAIDEAMAVVGERDRAVALEMLRQGNTFVKDGE